MKKPSAKSTTNYLKIGAAAKALGVSIDTLRRWEKSGKITAIRTPGGTRLYSLSQLKKVNPASVEDFQAKSLTTEELLKVQKDSEYSVSQSISESEYQTFRQSDISELSDTPSLSEFSGKKSLVTNFLIGTAVFSAFTLLITSWIAASYLTQPKETAQFFKNNVASGLLSPFHKLAEETVAVISPKKAKELGFAEHLRGEAKLTPIAHLGGEDVLAVTASPKFLEVNSDTQINGNLDVRDSINGLSLEGTPSASTITIASGGTTLTISDSATLDQDVSTASTPTFSSLTLSSTTNQLASGGFQFTLPGATTTLVGTNTTQTLTNKSMSGSANTFTNIPNSALTNKKITISAGTNLTGGGDVELGASVTLSVKGSPSLTGQVQLEDGTAAAPSLTFASDADTGLYRIGTNSIGLITAGSATSGITINASGNLGVGTITPTSTLHVVGTGNITSNATIGGTLGVTGATTLSSTLTVSGNTNIDSGTLFVDTSSNRVGIGTTTPGSNLGISGNVGIGESFATAASPSNGLAIQGNVGIGTTTPAQALHVIGSGQFSTSILNADGSASSPALSFTNDTDSGLWRVANNLIALTTGGGAVSGLAINSSGNVGIGTTSPTAALQVAGTTNIGGVISALTGGINIGSAGTRFGTIFADEVNATTLVGTISGGNVTANTVTINSDNATADTEDANLAFERGTLTPNALLTWDSTNDEFDLNSTLHLTGTILGNVGINLDATTYDITTPSGQHLSIFPGLGGTTGNVGIGTTTPGAQLSVASNATIGWGGTSSIAGPSSGLAVSGNVGVGTTSPVQALHVVGQCVAGDTLLRRRRRKQKSDVGDQMSDDDWEDVRIDQINPGDEILTLDEATGEFIPSTVRELMDMGIQQTYLLVTETGKQIRTTANHPYLVKESKALLLEESNISQKKSNHSNTEGYLSSNYSIMEINFHNPASFLSLNETSNVMIPNHPADRFINKSDNVINQTVSILTNLTISQNSKWINPSTNSGLTLSEAEWVKVSQLKTGMEVATIDGWEKIVEIKEHTREQVWDIEVENTHNFVGNDIVAHNTYITGNVGLGVTTPGSTLSINGNSVIGYSGVNIAGPSSGLAVSGNLGIGTTTTYVPLHVQGNGTNAAAFLNGNVGIGTTSPGTTFQMITDIEARRNFSLQHFQDDVRQPILAFAKGRGNAVNRSAVLNGDILGSISFTGFYDGYNGLTGASISGIVNGTVSSTSMPVDLVFLPGTSGGGTERMRLTSAGNLGIGTSLPNATLSIQGNVGIGYTGGTSSIPSGGLAVSGNVGIGTTTANSALAVAGGAVIGAGFNATAPTNGLLVQGNVGIGFTSPDRKLQIASDLSPAVNIGALLGAGGSQLSITGSTSDTLNTKLAFGVDTTFNYAFIQSGQTLGVGNTPPISLSINPAGGNVGIGISAPANKLVVDTTTNLGGLTVQVSSIGTPAIKMLSGSTNTSARNWGFLTNNVAIGNFEIRESASNGLASDPIAGTGAVRLFIASGGNVGIGTSAAGARLQVNGNGIFGFDTTTSIAGPSNGLAVSGNVGVGTTSPLQALHVVGQCVSWDTRIRVRRRRRKWDMGDGNMDDEVRWDYFEVMIKDILPGDEVLSLNEITQQFEYQKVEKLLDMGIKGVYELTTKSGRKIKTTGNHPYLVHLREEKMPASQRGEQLHLRGGNLAHYSPIQDAGWVKVLQLQVGDRIAVASSDLAMADSPATSAFSGWPVFYHQNESDGQKSIYNTSTNNPLVNITHGFPFLANQIARIKNTIAEGRLTVNNNSLSGLVNTGRINIEPNQPADRLVNHPDRTDNVSLSNNLLTTDQINIESNHFQWDEIVSIKYLGYEHVYDLQIEGTHNFVGNNIVAHNTYISGNVGIGFSTPLSLLQVSSTADQALFRVDDDGAGDSSPFIIGSNGNVGIGATDPNTLLEVRSATSTNLELVRFAAATAGGNFAVLSIVSTGSPTGDRALFGFRNDGSSANVGAFISAGATIRPQDLFVKASGNVGIGTTSPIANLHVLGGGTTSAVFLNGNVGIGNTIPGATLAITGNSVIGFGGIGGNIAGPSSGLAVSGNVGVGTTSPTRILELARDLNPAGTNASLLGADGTQFAISGSTFAKKLVLGIDTTDNFGVIQAGNTDGTNYNLALNPAGGNVGIGTASPGNKLDVFFDDAGTDTVVTVGRFMHTSSGTPAVGLGAAIDLGGELNDSITLQTFGRIAGVQTLNAGGGHGSLAFSTASGTTLTERMRILHNGLVGIGTTTPGTTFAVVGNSTIGFGSSVSTPAGPTSGLAVSGNVGVGTTSPTRILELARDLNPAGTNASLLGADGTQFAISGSTFAKKLVLGIDTTDNFGVIQAGNTDGTNYVLSLNPAGGNIGIGMTTPTGIFTIGASGLEDYIFSRTAGGATVFNEQGTDIDFRIESDANSRIFFVDAGLNSIGMSGNNIASVFLTIDPVGAAGETAFVDSVTPGLTVGHLLTTAGSTFRDTNTGINGTAAAANNIVFRTPSIRAGNTGVTITDAANVYIQGAMTASTNVTITNPYALWVDAGTSRFDGAVTYGAQATFIDSDATPNVSAGSHFITNTTAVTITDFDAGAGTLPAGQIIYVESNGAITYDCAPFLNLNCGAADIVTAAKDLTSWIFDGTDWTLINWMKNASTQTGADLAEWYVSAQTLEPGDVVSIAPNETAVVEKSPTAYDQKVIGIVSTQPSIILGSQEQLTFPIALAGRVPVKVSTENGPIEVGDFLTSSSTPGIAMKATRPGPTVGKALEAFDCTADLAGLNAADLRGQCQGKILTFINVSFADPSNFFASLSFDNQGNLIVPRIKVGKLALDPSVATAAAQLSIVNSQLSINEDPAYTSPGPNLATNTNQYIDLGGTIASLEDRIKVLEDKLASQGPALQAHRAQIDNLQDILGNVGIGATAANTTSVIPRSDEIGPWESSSSGKIATSSATYVGTPRDDISSNLTPPDILLYTGSATLANLTVTSEATMSGVLTAYQAQIQDHFKVLGTTTLASTQIVGDLTVDGTLSIEKGSEINVIGISQGQTLSTQGLTLTSGILYLQRSPLAQGLDIFNGKVTIDKDGVLKAVTLVADLIKINEGKSAGKGLILAGQTEVVVENPYVEESSIILVTPNTPLIQTLAVTDRTDKTATNRSFKVKLAHPEPVDINFDYLIIGINKSQPAPISQISPGGT